MNVKFSVTLLFGFVVAVSLIGCKTQKPVILTSHPSSAQLPFSSSGRLPTRLRGLALGSPLTVILRSNPGLQRFSAGPANQSTADATYSEKADEFEILADFSKGNLVYISASATRLSPEDALGFDGGVIQILGPPSVQLYRGSSEKDWVWIDGDVRIKYYNGAGFGSSSREPRRLSLELAVYPAFLESEHDPELARYEWGDREPHVVVRKELARGFGQLRLGTGPSQTRQALPGLDIWAQSTQKAHGVYKDANGDVQVEFWDGRASAICEVRGYVDPAQTTGLNERLERDFGTPIQRTSVRERSGYGIDWVMEWEDRNTQIQYTWITGMACCFSRCFYDRKLREAAAAQEDHRYTPAPEPKSFF